MIAYLIAIIISIYLVILNDIVLSPRTLLISVMVCLWTVRLGLFLFKRIKVEKEDKRFRNLKNSFSGFLFAWTVSATWVCLTASNAFTMIIANSSLIGDIYFIIGFILWSFGFIIEIIADQQKKKFKLDKENKDKFISTGLWSISRHPNYVGEITLWFGISIISFPILEGWQFITLISPIFVYLLLTKVSGVNMLEKRSDDQWGDQLEYQKYKKNTPVLFPFPKKIN
jgi:steroid 5-alpha reductase family enzyme